MWYGREIFGWRQTGERMKVQVNGEEMELAAGTTVAALLEKLGIQQQRLAVEINQEIVPRSQHGQHELQAGDRVEIVRAVGGG
jgi:sulfur carrier protein